VIAFLAMGKEMAIDEKTFDHFMALGDLLERVLGRSGDSGIAFAVPQASHPCRSHGCPSSRVNSCGTCLPRP
jgi:hypothetical protein